MNDHQGNIGNHKNTILVRLCKIGNNRDPDGSDSIKNPPAVQETWVGKTLEVGMATHYSILAWRIPWTEEPVGYSSWGRKESDTTERLSTQHTGEEEGVKFPVGRDQ